jgi:hypothetical protein
MVIVKAFTPHPPLWVSVLHRLLLLLVPLCFKVSTIQAIDECAKLYNYDCYGCILNGCYWCPGDALCSGEVAKDDSGSIGNSFFVRDGKLDVGKYVINQKFPLLLSPLQSSCPKADDYVTTTCTSAAATIIRTSSSSENFFSDPNYSAQEWVFNMINIQSVWAKKYFGVGIMVRINDGTITSSASSPAEGENDDISMSNTPELDPTRIDLDASCTYSIEDLHGDDNDNDGDNEQLIGNTVASILGATGGNDQCAVGIAPEVTFSTCRPPTNITSMLDGPSLSTVFLAYNVDTMDVSQNSWSATLDDRITSAVPQKVELRRRRRRIQSVRGVSAGASAPSLCLEGLDDCNSLRTDPITLLYEELPALVTGIEDGRDGRGVIYVFAAGDTDDSSSSMSFRKDVVDFYSMYEPWYNTRYTISVGAVGKNGLHAYYSARSASLFVSAPGGNMRDSVSNMIGLNNDGRCTDVGHGTGLATPVVSAVVALMLEANPRLSWRDVRAIIAKSSEPVESDSSDDKTADINSAGYWHSNKYGFGIIQADRAIEESETWDLLGRELSLTLISERSLDVPISGDPSEPSSDSIDAEQIGIHVPVVVETVYLFVKIQTLTATHRLHIQLTSPGGMTSTWTPKIDRTTDDPEWYKFVTVRSWGESPHGGSWTLSLYEMKSETIDSDDDGDDGKEEDSNNQNIISEWRLSVFGHQGPPVPTSPPSPTPLPRESSIVPTVEGTTCQSIGKYNFVGFVAR